MFKELIDLLDDILDLNKYTLGNHMISSAIWSK